MRQGSVLEGDNAQQLLKDVCEKLNMKYNVPVFLPESAKGTRYEGGDSKRTIYLKRPNG